MGDAKKAEQTAKHFAAMASPALAATPFGTRSVPSAPAVSFQVAVGAAVKTFGNSAPLFLLRSKAIDPKGTFQPTEALFNNPVEGSFATAHGHVGIITLPNGAQMPGAINAGVLTGPTADCGAKIAQALDKIMHRLLGEIQNPISFMQNYQDGQSEVYKILGDDAKSFGSSLWGMAKSAWHGAVSAYNYLDTVTPEQFGKDAVHAAESGAEAVGSAVKSAVAGVQQMYNVLSKLTPEQMEAILKQWLTEMFGALTCKAADALSKMADDPKPIAKQLGELNAMVTAKATEAAAVIAATALTEGAAGELFASAEAAEGAEGAATLGSAAEEGGGGMLKSLFSKFEEAAEENAEKEGVPSKVPSEPPPEAPPEGESGGPKEPNKDSVEGEREGESEPCPVCPVVGSPVNPVLGCKVLNGGSDLDFVLDGPLPLAWQRTYVSSNASSGWLGQGWSLPIGFRLEAVRDGVDFIDTQGRRTLFPQIAVGKDFFSKYEHTTLKRSQRNHYELVDADGLRLVFGPNRRDQGRLAEKQAAEEVEARRHQALLEQLRAEAEARGETIDPAPPPDLRPPQVDTLVLLEIVDRNDNWLRIHYDADDLPQMLGISGGRCIRLNFDPPFDKDATPRLTGVDELIGDPDPRDGRFTEARPLVSYRYSAAGDLIEVADGKGAVVRRFAWRQHMMLEHGEPGGQVSRYEWDRLSPDGKVTRNALSTGEVLRFVYGADSTFVTDAGDRTTTFRFDQKKRFTGMVDAEGGASRFELDAYGNLQAIIDPCGRISRYTHNSRGLLIHVEHPDGSQVRIAYHPEWRKPVEVTNPMGESTRYAYDDRGNLIEVIAPDGARTSYQVDSRGLPVEITDARDGVSRLDYDIGGRLLGYTDCVGHATRYEYDDTGNLIRAIDALGQITRYRYRRINRQDRLVAVELPDGSTERHAYDPLGRLIGSHDALGRTTRYLLDAKGSPLLRENSLGHRLRYQYDTHGRLVALANENDAVYRFAWDRLDRLVSEQGFDGRRIDCRYNAAGELLETADGVPQGAALMAPGQTGVVRTQYLRDAMGRLLHKTSIRPADDGQGVCTRHNRYSYDAAGRMVRARNRHARIDLHYTPAGRLAREVTYTRGGLVSTLQHRYDGLGNRVATVLPDGRTLENQLYGSGHLDKITLDGTVVCSFERDQLYRETVRTQGALTSFFDRDPMGRLVYSRARASDPGAEPTVARRYQYDRAGQLLHIQDKRKGLTSYQYDPLGRLLSAQSPQSQEHFAFDPASNLLDGARAGETQPFVRNWTEQSWDEETRRWAERVKAEPVLASDQAAAASAAWPAGSAKRLETYQDHRYRYDSWGNCVEKRSGPHQVRTFQWDAAHQLERAHITRLERGELVSEQWGYDYDPFGRRIAKYRIDETTEERHARRRPDATHFAWDGRRLLLERCEERQVLYLYEPDSFVPLAVVRSALRAQARLPDPKLPAAWMAVKDRHPEVWTKMEQQRREWMAAMGHAPPEPENPEPAEVLYVHADHLGTPQELTDADGHVVWSASYQAWGKTLRIEHPPRWTREVSGNTVKEYWLEQADPVTLNLRFQGQYFDQETGLHYNRFRYYDPDVGHYMSQDPIGLLGGTNIYRYASNPTGWIDPLGLSCWGDLLVKNGLPKPTDMKRPHGHHIIFKGDFEHLPDMQAALERSRAVVQQYGIDPVNDVGALMWAPNEGHSVANAETVAEKLEAANKDLISKGVDPKSPCGKLAMMKELQRIGKEVFTPSRR